MNAASVWLGRRRRSGAIPGAIPGERGPAWVKRGTSIQSKVQNALALAVVALLGGGFLLWYYSRVATTPPPVEETRAKAAAAGEMALPPLGPAPVKAQETQIEEVSPLIDPTSAEGQALLAGGDGSRRLPGLRRAGRGLSRRGDGPAAAGSGAAATARGAGADSWDRAVIRRRRPQVRKLGRTLRSTAHAVAVLRPGVRQAGTLPGRVRHSRGCCSRRARPRWRLG